jgi:hypothetical protein
MTTLQYFRYIYNLECKYGWRIRAFFMALRAFKPTPF